MAAAGKIHSQVTTRPLEHVNEAIADLRNGKVSGRIVLTPR
jgi:D-arabinose 1-dehydrogenase-like Zn-dependent alcohol dehydrogenase